MKQKQPRKSLVIFALALSLCSFLYVNIDAYVAGSAKSAKDAQIETKIKIEPEENDAGKLPVPAVLILSKLVDLVHKLTISAP